jgi:hypothetical protein
MRLLANVSEDSDQPGEAALDNAAAPEILKPLDDNGRQSVDPLKLDVERFHHVERRRGVLGLLAQPGMCG